ncbi:hypothetical protein F4825DRAFT_456260 [Nemania diffusa]|nr:hypothetical protein F4825DRAFT_456260 [Nemania diffusa]
MDDKHALGLATRYANTEVSLLRGGQPAEPASVLVQVQMVDQDDASVPRDYRNYHRRNYSDTGNKNWNQQQQRQQYQHQYSDQDQDQDQDQSPGSISTGITVFPSSPPLQYNYHNQQLQHQQPPQHHQLQQLQQQQQQQPREHVPLSPTHSPRSYVHFPPAAPHHHQPYRSSSQPPRLPPLAAPLPAISLSPFDPDPFSSSNGSARNDGDNTNNYSLSFAASRALATSNSNAISAIPRVPVQADEIVSPISETRSSTPVFRSLDRDGEPIAHAHCHFLATATAAQPYSRFASPPAALHRQPTNYSSAGASLLDDKEFERSLGATERVEHTAVSPSHSTFAAISSAVAHDVAHLTDEKSDDWFRFTARESAVSSGSNSRPEAHQTMSTVAMTGDGWSAPEHPHQHQLQQHQLQDHQLQQQQQQQQQQHQHQYQQQSDQHTVTRSSFTPLPPIRRTSTFDLLRKKSPVDDDSDAAPSPIEQDIPAMPSGPADAAQQTSNGQLAAGQGASQASPHTSVQPQSQPQQDVNQNLNVHSHGHGQPVMSQHPNGHAAAAAAAATEPVGQPGMPQQPTMQMHSPPMMMGRGAPAGQQVAPGQMVINGEGQPFPFPGRGGQWTAQLSVLAEPLNSSNRSRSANPPQAYAALDKETEPHFGGAPPQTRPRNSSNPMPPTATTRFPAFFPASAEQQQFARNQAHPLSHYGIQNGNARPRNSFDEESLSKEMGVPSIVSEDSNDNPKRISGSLFNIGHRRNSSNLNPIPPGSADGASEKKKTGIFGIVAGIGHSHPKPKSNLGLVKTPTSVESDQVSLRQREDSGPAMTKLSELKGMIKGVGNAKEGAKDDISVKVEPMYESRQSIQGPPPNVAAPLGNQGPQRHPGPFVPPVPPGMFGLQGQARAPGPRIPIQPHPSQMGYSAATGPNPLVGVGRATTSGPQLGQIQQPKSEDGAKKGSGGGFFGGLFNKQGKKTKDARSQSPQLMPPSSQQTTQPPMQTGYMTFRPGQMHQGQQPGPHPMFAGQPRPPGQTPSPTLSQDPNQPSPSLETARAVAIRRPSEITVSSQGHSGAHQSPNQRPPIHSPQGSQGTFRQQAPSPLGQRPGQMGMQNDGGMVASQTSPRLSIDSTLERPSIGNSSAIPRFSPNRKPVGSGNSKGSGPFMTSAVSPDLVSNDRSAPSPSPRQGEHRASSQVSPAQQNPQLGSFGGLNEMRKRSLTSPEPSPVPSQSNQSVSSRVQGDPFARDSRNLRDSGQGLGVLSTGLSSPGSMNPSGPGGTSNGSAWGPNGARPSVPPLIAPSVAAGARLPTPSSPVPIEDKLIKFFGAYDNGKPTVQPQVNKEKSAASKILGAFKRSSKQSETPQTTPKIPQGETPTSGAIPRPSGAPPRQHPIPPVQSGQGRGQISAQQMQAGRGQPGQVQWVPGPAQAGRGQMIPGIVMQGGRGQIPTPMFAGTGPVPSHMQRSTISGKQGDEPQYDQVPIPHGYNAVHGYGAGGMVAPSPYNAGRTGHPPIQYIQYAPGVQPGFPQQQWDPRMAGLPPGAVPGVTRIVSQGMPSDIPHQGTPQQPQPQGLPQNTSPLPPMPGQSQIPPQQFLQSRPMHQAGQFSSQEQGQAPVRIVQTPQPQLAPPQADSFQQASTPSSQAQPNSWTGTPQTTHSPVSVQQTNSSTPIPVLQTSLRSVSISGSNTSNGTPPLQSQQIVFTVPSQAAPLAQANSTHQHSPVHHHINPSAQALSQAQHETSRPPTYSPSSATTAASAPFRSPDVARLTSRMSVSKHATRSSASFGSDKPADRTLTVSPEPPGPRHGPIHQVSEQNLSVNVERANNHTRHASEDIYDATPRLNNYAPQGQGEDLAHENTKYAGSEKGRGVMNGAGAAAAGTVVVVAEDNMSFLDGPDDSESDENQGAGIEESNAPPRATPVIMGMNMEPEEKILVDQPVELAAVNDDDDGIHMMTATSYPGQEWNPYVAGEFGDYE